ncbi:hypothetical protein [Peribacillus sp. SCS-155]|uniref:hypothetical protein n=1 Tax=Peribacillus sedimenti TaxID=3115297 RepID=UPI003905BDE9
MKKSFSILLVVLLLLSAASFDSKNASAATMSFSTKVSKTKSLSSLKTVLTGSKWYHVEYDTNGKNVRFMAFKNVNPYGGGTGLAVLRAQKIGGYYTDVTIANPQDKDVLYASKRVMQLIGVPVDQKSYFSIIDKAMKYKKVYLAKWGKYQFRVYYDSVNKGLYLLETEYNKFK